MIRARHPNINQGKLFVGRDFGWEEFTHTGYWGCGSKEVDIDTTGNIWIGSHVEISDGVTILTHKHKWTKEPRRNNNPIITWDLTIEADSFIGINAIIMCERIGEGAVIGAGAVVTKNVPPYEVWGGNPAKKIGERK